MADISKIKLPDGTTYNVKDTNAISGSGTSGSIAKFNGTNSVTSGPALGNSTEFFLRNDGTWNYPLEPKSANGSDGEYPVQFLGTTQESGTTFSQSGFSRNLVFNPDHVITGPFANKYAYLKLSDDNPDHDGITMRSDGIINAPDGAFSTGTVYATGTIFSNTGLYSNGIVSCYSMNVVDISDQYSISKTSGQWSVASITAFRTGNVVQIFMAYKGNGSAVSAGGNGFTGTITSGPIPVSTARAICLSGTAVGYSNIDSSGGILARPHTGSMTLSSSSRLAAIFIFICA